MLSDLVVCYLFLGGAGGGACLVLAVMGLLSPRDEIAARVVAASGRAAVAAPLYVNRHEAAMQSRTMWLLKPPSSYRRLFVAGHTISLVALALGVACLIVDLARADRVALVFLSPTPTFITLGVWFLTAALALTCLILVLWMSFACVRVAALRIVQAALAVASLGVILYTGLMLQGIDAVPLWATPWLPVLFALSSLSCGMALVLIGACANGTVRIFRSVMRRMVIVDVAVIVLEAIACALLVGAALQGNSPLSAIDGSVVADNPTQYAALVSAGELLGGQAAWVFWLGFVGVGLVAPIALECIVVAGRRRVPVPALMCVPACCVLVGGLVMRYCIVAAGVHPMVASIGNML